MVSFEFCIQKNEASHDQANFNFNKRTLISIHFRIKSLKLKSLKVNKKKILKKILEVHGRYPNCASEGPKSQTHHKGSNRLDIYFTDL